MVPLVDEQKIREAAARLEELEQKGATLDYILKGPEGYVWIEEACSGDRKPRMQVSLKSCETEETPATPGAGGDMAPRTELSRLCGLFGPRFSG